MARSIAAHPPKRIAPDRARARAPRQVPSHAPRAPADALRAALIFFRDRRRARIALLAVVIALPLLAGGWLWFRQSSFVSIERVEISGVHGASAPAVEAALVRAAHGMSSLDASDGALRAAVAPFRVVSEVRAIPRFPHALRIEVVEQLPVAILDAAGVRTAVAADGVVLGPSLVSGALPSVSAPVAPAAGRRVGGAEVLGELAVLGAAPAVLARHVERVFTGAKGLTVAMHNGLLVYFGDDTRPHAKWLSLARVLADPSSAGASYVDVRLPSHPAAGFPTGVNPPDASTTPAAGSGASGEQPGSSESTVASLAASLASGSGVSSTTSEPSTSAGASTAPSPSASEPAAGAQASATPGTEASSGAQTEPSTSTPPGG